MRPKVSHPGNISITDGFLIITNCSLHIRYQVNTETRELNLNSKESAAIFLYGADLITGWHYGPEGVTFDVLYSIPGRPAEPHEITWREFKAGQSNPRFPLTLDTETALLLATINEQRYQTNT